MNNPLVEKYFRQDMLPHIWCSGCGNGILLMNLVEAIDALGLEKDKVVIVSGIGCSSRASGYLDFNTIHTTHGRAIPVATGIKMAKPELTVIVITGDGDATAIGGNHFIHGSRRNIDLTVLVFNNNIYGMTGGQYSPTTGLGEFGTTAPYGNIDQPFDITTLAAASGATYVGRSTAAHHELTVRLIKNAITHKGFSVLDLLSMCPTYYGRKNRKGDAVAMMKGMKQNSVTVQRAETMQAEELEGKVVIGEIHVSSRPEYSDEYKRLTAIAKGRAAK